MGGWFGSTANKGNIFLNILFFIRSLGSGGAERQLVNLAIGLKERGHEISVVTMYSGGVFEHTLRATAIPIYCLEKARRWQVLSPLIQLQKIVQMVQPDILHSYGPETNVFLVLHRLFFKKYLLVWGVRVADLPRKMYGQFESFLYWFECRWSRVPDLVISNSEAGKNLSIKDGFDKSRIKVIQNGIDTDEYRPDSELRNQFRARMGLAAEIKVIGIVGRIDPQKDHQTFIEAVSLLPDHQKAEVAIICVGFRNEQEIRALREQVKSLGLEQRFIWLKRESSTVTVLNGLDILVSSSISEGFSNVIAEGLAVGLPCVVTDVGDSKLIVSEYGVVVPRKDPQALADGISQMLLDSRLRNDPFSEAARNHIVSKFSIDILVSNTETTLQRLIDEGSPYVRTEKK
ncbi:glycosyltransferase [Gammaproteobacteria bacterium]|nr:glycosyltransferase [Gammaproteobacteria bacterium]